MKQMTFLDLCSGIGRRKADGIFYCIDVFRGKVEAVVL